LYLGANRARTKTQPMRALVLREVGGPMNVETVPDPVPREGEALLEVMSCGICHTDLHVIKGEVAFPMPCVLGHEIAGVVRALGPGVHGIRPGDRVVTSFIMPCGICYQCIRGRDDLCEQFFLKNRQKGTLLDGETRLADAEGNPIWMYSMAGLADYCVTPVSAVYRIPDEVTTPDAALLGCSGLTAFGALNTAALRAADTLAVIAVGGVGLNVVQLAAVMGASRIFAVDLKDAKLQAAQRLGATDLINAADVDPTDAILEATNGAGVDIAIEALGSAATISTAINTVKDGGRVVIVGIAPTGVEASFDITRLVRRKIEIRGSYGARPRVDMPRLISLAATGRIDMSSVVSEHVTLEEADAAYRRLSDGEIIGRAVVTMRD